MSENVKPFSNATEADYWMESNCERCSLNGYRFGGKPCEMEEAVSMGYIVGTIDAEMAAEYGATLRGDFCDMPRQCKKWSPPTRCEFIRWKGTRRQSKCGKAGCSTVEAHGFNYTVCPMHERRVARMER